MEELDKRNVEAELFIRFRSYFLKMGLRPFFGLNYKLF